ncbi:MAG: hypothetical protein IT168_18895 [Bryobacterales bacterium]|nr:hypothetical protein [Bryobacterales bacterium]
MRLARFGVVLIISVYLAWNTRGALTSPFTPDDMMNLYGAWETGWPSLVKALWVPSVPIARPLGGLYYLSLYSVFGLNPIPFHVVCLGLVAVNVVLVYCLLRSLDGSYLPSLIATLLFAFHIRMADLYYSSGTVYDLLAAFWVILLALFMLKAGREANPPVRRVVWNLLISAGLFGLAIGSKEHAVMVISVLTVFAFVLRHSGKAIGWPLTVCWVIAAVYTYFRASKSGPLASAPAYTLTIEPARVLTTAVRYLESLVLQPAETLSVLYMLAGSVLIAALLMTRSRIVFLGLSWLLLTSLPILMIPPRGLFALYLPLIGLWMVVGGMLTWATPRSWDSKPPAIVGVTCVVALCLTWVWERHRAGMLWWTEERSKNIMRLMADSSGIPLARGSSVLMRNDPFQTDEWTPLFVLRLAKKDPTLAVFRTKMEPSIEFRDTDFDVVITYGNDKAIRSVRFPRSAGPAP